MTASWLSKGIGTGFIYASILLAKLGGRIRMAFRGVGADPSAREASTMLLRPTTPNDVLDETTRVARIVSQDVV